MLGHPRRTPVQDEEAQPQQALMPAAVLQPVRAPEVAKAPLEVQEAPVVVQRVGTGTDQPFGCEAGLFYCQDGTWDRSNRWSWEPVPAS